MSPRQTLVLSAATASAVLAPLQLVAAPLSSRLYAAVEAAVTLVFLADLALNLRGPRSRREAPSGGRGAQRPRSPQWPWLAADALAALPIALVAPGSPLALLRLLKLVRVGQLLARSRRREDERWHVLRFATLSYWLALMAHGLACFWLALHNRMAGADDQVDYLQALYWTVQTLTTVGYGDMSFASRGERVLAMAVMVLGVGVYATIIGAVASIVMAVDPARAHHIESMERLAVFMEHKNVPRDLRQRIRDYTAYVWDKRLGYDEATILGGLPPGLLLELSLFLKRDVLEKVPFFQGASTELLGELALALRPVVFTPGDTIFRWGDLGDEMYFISRGRVEILARDGGVLATLSDGGFFGEIALFMKQPRTASVRAVDYCDLYALGLQAFERVLARHPEFQRHIEEMIRARQERG